MAVAAGGLMAWTAPETARGDGMFVWHDGADLGEPAQRAIIAWDGKTETLLLSVKYEGAAEDFAWIVPLPAKPVMKAIDADKNPFPEISHFTRRRDWAIRAFVTHMEGMPPHEVEVFGSPSSRRLRHRHPGHEGFRGPCGLAQKERIHLPRRRTDLLDHYAKKQWVYAAMRIDPKQLVPLRTSSSRANSSRFALHSTPKRWSTR